jgi:hypothetical protein
MLSCHATQTSHAEPAVTDERGNEVVIQEYVIDECSNETIATYKRLHPEIKLDAGELIEIFTYGPNVIYCEVEWWTYMPMNSLPTLSFISY